MTETIDTANLRALAEAADAQPYNIIATGYYTVAMNKLKARPDQVVALLDRLAAAEARNASLTDDAARPRDLLLEFFRLENAPRHQCTCDDRDEWDKEEHHAGCSIHEDLRNFERMDEIMTLLREAVGHQAHAMKEKTP